MGTWARHVAMAADTHLHRMNLRYEPMGDGQVAISASFCNILSRTISLHLAEWAISTKFEGYYDRMGCCHIALLTHPILAKGVPGAFFSLATLNGMQFTILVS
jgi:hypothetical protein